MYSQTFRYYLNFHLQMKGLQTSQTNKKKKAKISSRRERLLFLDHRNFHSIQDFSVNTKDKISQEERYFGMYNDWYFLIFFPFRHFIVQAEKQGLFSFFCYMLENQLSSTCYPYSLFVINTTGIKSSNE